MSSVEVDNIVDDRVRTLVKDKLDRLDGDPKKAFADPNNHPYLTAGDGPRILIHTARIRKPVAVIPLGNPFAPLCRTGQLNHHMEIFAVS